MSSTEILKLEFDYAKQTSLAAQDDRLKIVNFYLGLYATVLTLVFGLQNISEKNISSYTFLILLLLGFVSFIFNIQIIRLRQAWIDSVVAMNSIKQYFLEQDPKLKKYLKWTLDTIPKAHKFKTINFLSSLVINILGAISIALAFSNVNFSNLAIFSISFAYFLISQFAYYIMLKRNI